MLMLMMSRMILTTLAKYWYCGIFINSAETILRELHVRFDNMSDVQTDRWTSIFILNKTVALFRRSLQEKPSLRTAVFDGGEMRTGMPGPMMIPYCCTDKIVFVIGSFLVRKWELGLFENQLLLWGVPASCLLGFPN
jgi:hypothetical protein